MQLKSSIAALGFVAALTAFGTAPASANANVANDVIAATEGTTGRDVSPVSSRCGCYRPYVRYYRVYPAYRVYRVYRVRYYYI
jgi:hypothetical protein